MLAISAYSRSPENARLIEAVYECLAFIHLDDYIVLFSDLLERMYEEIEESLTLQLIEESVERGDHELYGTTPDEFRKSVYSGAIELIEGDADLGVAELTSLIEDYLKANQYFYEGYFGLVNPPLQEVW